MSINIDLRPAPHMAAGAPIAYHFTSDRVRQSAGAPTAYVLSIQALPPDGSFLQLEGYRLFFVDAGFDAFNPFHISLGGSPSAATLAQRVAEALETGRATAQQFAPPSVQSGPPATVAIETAAAAAPGGPAGVVRPDGTPFTDPANDPLSLSLTPGQPPVFRPNYQLRLELRLSDPFQPGAAPAPVAELFQPASGRNLPAEAFRFRLDGILAPFFGFDLPQPMSAQLQHAPRVLRQAEIRYWEFFGRGQASGKLFADLVDDLPYRFTVLNAARPAFPHLPRLAADDTDCPEPGTLVQDPSMTPFIRLDAPRFLTERRRKRAVPGQPELLGIYANPANGGFSQSVAADQLAMNYVLRFLDGRVGLLCIPLGWSDARRCVPDAPTLGSVWLLPVHKLWAELSARGLDARQLDHFCFSLSGPCRYVETAAGLVQGADGLTLGTDTGFPTPIGDPSVVIGGPAMDAQAFSWQAAEEEVLPPGTTAELRMQVFRPGRATAAGDSHLSLKPLNEDVPAQNVEVLSSIDWAEPPRNQWVELRTRITNQGEEALQLLPALKSDAVNVAAGEDPVVWLTGLSFILSPGLTEDLRFEVEADCAAPQSLLFQNRLGVAEVFHLPRRASIEQELSVEREEAGLAPNRLPVADAEGRNRLQLASPPERTETALTFPLLPEEAGALTEMLTAPSAYVLEPPEAPPAYCSNPAAESGDWRPEPILWETEEVALREAGVQAPEVELSWRRARQSPRLRS